MNEWMDGCMGGWKNEQKDGWMDGRTDRWMDGWMDTVWKVGTDQVRPTYTICIGCR